MGRNQALPLLPVRILGTQHVKKVPKHQENTKLSEYPAVPLKNFVFR